LNLKRVKEEWWAIIKMKGEDQTEEVCWAASRSLMK
jgi:hypothetical protein